VRRTETRAATQFRQVKSQFSLTAMPDDGDRGLKKEGVVRDGVRKVGWGEGVCILVGRKVKVPNCRDCRRCR